MPSLNDRKEDIPLFVERLGGGRRPDDRFLYALLKHDWRDLEVDGLLTSIRTAVSRTPEGQPLTVNALREKLPADSLAEATALHEQVVGDKLYRFLIDLLQQQGFGPGIRGRSLNVRLGKLMGVHRTTIDRRLKELGLSAHLSSGE